MILGREIRDQLRDRRTLFMIAVLPVLLYPLLGMSMLQVSQFMQEQPTRVLVVGAKDIAGLPPLFENQQFAGRLFADPSRTKLLELHFTPDGPPAAERNAPPEPGPKPTARCRPASTKRRSTFRPTSPAGSTPSARPSAAGREKPPLSFRERGRG